MGSNPTFSKRMVVKYKSNRFSKERVSLKVSSYNKNSLILFFRFLKTSIFFENCKFKIIKLKQKKTLISLLKSPHVNKTAQEQFCREKFSFIIIFEQVNRYNLMLYFKTLFSKGFSDITLMFNSSFYFNNSVIDLNPDKKHSNFSSFNTFDYLRLLEAYGEVVSRRDILKRQH